jgi:hypothetical protein
MFELLKKIIAISFLSILLFALIHLCVERIIINNTTYNTFKYKQNPTYFVAGNSRPHNAFNDSIITGMVNITEVAESYFFIYLKLKTLIKHNKKLEVVFLEFDNNQITEKMNTSTYGDTFLSVKVPIFSPFMTFDEKWQLYNWNNDGFGNAYLLANRLNLIKVIRNKVNVINDFGWYFPSPHKRLDSLIRHAPLINERNTFKKNENRISSLNLIYLRKCIEICRNNNVRIILIRSPLHEKSPMLGNDSTYNNILHTSFKDVEYIDFKNYIVPDSCYADFTHFNFYGADIFSKWFDLQLKSGLMRSNNMQHFVDSGIINSNIQFK